MIEGDLALKRYLFDEAAASVARASVGVNAERGDLTPSASGLQQNARVWRFAMRLVACVDWLNLVEGMMCRLPIDARYWL
mgnify:CR=1 FL=1